MKALSLWEPWASLIAQGSKTIETRSWHTNYRGPVLIHAAKRWGRDQQKLVDICWPIAMFFPADWTPPLGCALAVATLADCFSITAPMIEHMQREADAWDHGGEMTHDAAEYYFGDWKVGRFGWLFRDVRPITPFPVRGRQGLWDCDDDSLALTVAVSMDDRIT